MKHFIMSLVLVLASAGALRAQAALPVTTLEIDVDNVVAYADDVMDPVKKATATGVTPLPSGVTRIMKMAIAVGDIVAINGKPAKGLYTYRFGPGMMATTTLTPGRAIADVPSGCPSEAHFLILQPDGTLVGSIDASGSNTATPPPGAPGTATGMMLSVVGGTGPYMGARGQLTRVSDTARTASMLEDPAYRRVNGGGKRKEIIQLVPMSRPEILTIAVGNEKGPAVWHGADFSPVSIEKPAQADEILILAVNGLGPTKPAVDYGKPFPPSGQGGFCTVTSPVAVTVNGEPAEVLNSFGWPDSTGVYRVDIRVPAGVRGVTSLVVSAAWVPSPEVKLPVK